MAVKDRPQVSQLHPGLNERGEKSEARWHSSKLFV
ncbi:hypothetical protein SS1G_02739 [Sclerotinia sclerotiorum 1980 UF-70]|uniref:Uncharacterized protein n=1 Tax=Sclerotinia sclerotiorum (strain ATCC 18683 / 1980 / Ss-1) TaxID=665079 RepID=A7EBQ3_SCLS1|nr:hypothetical protein SS1G_02739 [Sclerotinia sclerotiorum 1980 UF-70]EDN99881.1 hypothetical protein SS1G_02739 [Sclerotinia sclerotiorum 1980 UF-70]